MKEVLVALLAALRAGFRSRLSLQLEVLALRHQLAVYQRPERPRRVQTRRADRLLWVALARWWSCWRDVLFFVQPQTVSAWQRRGFAISGRGRVGDAVPGAPPSPVSFAT